MFFSPKILRGCTLFPFTTKSTILPFLRYEGKSFHVCHVQKKQASPIDNISRSFFTTSEQQRSSGFRDRKVFQGALGALMIGGIFSLLMQERAKNLIFDDTEEPLSPALVGGKAANLQKLKIDGISVPRWFVLMTAPFKQYLKNNHLFDLILQLDLCCQDPENKTKEISELVEKIQTGIVKGTIDEPALSTILAACTRLSQEIHQTDVRFAVRSSGVMEDGNTFSCAGLYETILNCKSREQIVEAIKVVWASSFNLRVVQERMRLGVKQSDCLMGVIVQELIDARASGVASTIVLGNNFPGIQIAANYGAGESIVGGEVDTDSWVIHPTQGYILEQIKGIKEFCYTMDSDGGTKKTEVTKQDREKFALTPKEVYQLARQIHLIKVCYGCEIDVEFALNPEGKLFILQARPLVTVSPTKMMVLDPEDAKKHQTIAKGLYSVPGISSGRLVFIPSLGDLESGKIKLSKNDIVLAYITTNTWSQHLAHVNGVITREGSPSAHPILLSREKGIPCVIGIHEHFEELVKSAGNVITIDGVNRVIYEGSVATKEATAADFRKPFEPIKVREWPDVGASLPHLLHNKMVVEHEGKYWRRTPTYPLTGFQLELNMKRFDIVPVLLGAGDKVRVVSKIIDGYSCNELAPFADYVFLFKNISLKDAAKFNLAHAACLKDFVKKSETFELDPAGWHQYIDQYAQFRAFIWLGAAFRAYAERQVDEIGVAKELPSFYLEECAETLQAEMPELDGEMSKDVHLFAERFRGRLGVQKVEELRSSDPEAFIELIALAKKYRFEHTISLDKPLDFNVAFKRIQQEQAIIEAGGKVASRKQKNMRREFLPDAPELREWLRLSIENRILQSDSHQLDARAKEHVRPQLLKLGSFLVEKQMLQKPEQIFGCTIHEIAEYMKIYRQQDGT